MYRIAKNVIEAGRYDLEDMSRKLDSIWLQGDLTEGEHTELLSLARENADPAGSVVDMVNNLDGRVTALEACVATPVTPNLNEKEYPPYEEGRPYRAGDTCTFEGKRYTCTLPADGTVTVCPWSPAVRPDCWQEAA